MQFTRLRLVGFKSFVEPAEFVIERGLTGVVGPNGCGKSNLVEALRWVMGENSYKNMRASGMDDVIFSGSGLRPARNAAEVTLYLDNSGRSAPDVFNDADELQVSRRIERDKGSAYRINGRDVRAKDVQLLFADQSTGARSPSMVGQGRIGELISARPQARRALLEEAAGISGLHSRRREAEQRLRAAGGNLDRLEDIAGDLAGRIEGLKRQARQAQRFRQLSADIRKAEAGLFYVRWVEAKSQEAEAQSRFSTATVAVGEAAAVQIRAARAQEAGRAELPAAREAAMKAQAAVQRLRLGAQTLEAEQDRVRQRHAELTGRLQQLAEDIAREEALLQENADNAQRLDGEEAQLLEEDTATAGEEQRLADALQQIAARVTQQEEVLAVARASQAERNAAHVQLQRLIVETAERDKKLAADIAAVESELTALAADIASMAAADDLRAQSAQQAGLLAEAEEKAAAAENAVLRARTRETEAQAQSAEARDTLRGYEAEARTLQQMLAAFAGEGHAAVVEGLVVKRGFEIALGAALGDDLEASFDTAAPICWQDMSIGMVEDPAMPAGVLPLADVVEAPPPLQRRLAQIGIVEMQEAAALQPQLATGQCLVSREGALWRWDGLTARADAPTAAAQRLAQKNRLGELAVLLGKARSEAEAAHAALEEVQDMVRRKVEHERAVRAQAADLRRNLDTLRHELAGFERTLAERISRRDALQENRTRLAADYRENAARLAGMEEKRKALPPPDAQEKAIAAGNSRLADLRTAMAQAHAAQAAWRHALQSRKNRQALLAGERETWRQRIANSERQLHTLRQRRDAAADEMQQLAARPDEFETRKSALFDKIAQAQTTAQAVTDRLAEVERAQAALDRAALEAAQALAAVREERVRAEERLNAAAERRAAIEASIAEALSCLPHETMTHAGFTDGARLPDAQALERNLEKLRLERERLGAVNLQAEDESAEITKRYEVLVAERDDVIAAIKKLRLAIQTLNREGRERLLEAFDKVNLSFQHLFSHLFGGGTAELQLVESEDPLEAGLEILARPPGKKPQTMTLLSGGEQALTAMALIFAVFLTNPAPVCVLDEVDAPLDDHNVERYCNLMDEMAASTKTRFIIITHNPITMARMNRLFGVTMGEQGVSQLVSVDLQTASDMRETV